MTPTRPRPGYSQLAPLGRRYADLAAAGPQGRAADLAGQAAQAALADDAAALGRVAAEACREPALAGVVISILAQAVASLASETEAR